MPLKMSLRKYRPCPRPRLTRIVHSVGRDWKARLLVANACTVGINVYRLACHLATPNPKRAVAPDGHNRDDMLANARMYIDGLLKSAKCRPLQMGPILHLRGRALFGRKSVRGNDLSHRQTVVRPSNIPPGSRPMAKRRASPMRPHAGSKNIEKEFR
jgi:hypothetical protein